MPALRGGGRGDHYVKITVEIPTRLTEAQKEKLKDFAKACTEKDNHL